MSRCQLIYSREQVVDQLLVNVFIRLNCVASDVRDVTSSVCFSLCFQVDDRSKIEYIESPTYKKVLAGTRGFGLVTVIFINRVRELV